MPNDPAPGRPAPGPMEPAAHVPPARQTVTGEPRGRRTPRPVRARSEIDEQTVLGAAYVSSLMRSQLRAAFIAFGVLAVLLGSLPLVFALLPDDAGLWPSGPSPTWAVLGVLAYPVLVVIARWYVRRVERNERDFSDLVE